MPYIPDHHRPAAEQEPRNAGELNFAITSLLIHYMQEQAYSYKNMNDVLGALEGAKLEFYRRVVAPYEDIKRGIHGDVY